jgi:E3 ubiquitin-protein ligase HUWE1
VTDDEADNEVDDEIMDEEDFYYEQGYTRKLITERASGYLILTIRAVGDEAPLPNMPAGLGWDTLVLDNGGHRHRHGGMRSPFPAGVPFSRRSAALGGPFIITFNNKY